MIAKIEDWDLGGRNGPMMPTRMICKVAFGVSCDLALVALFLRWAEVGRFGLTGTKTMKVAFSVSENTFRNIPATQLTIADVKEDD